MIGPRSVSSLFGIVWYLLAGSNDSNVHVVFGRPGAGKTTIANLAVEKLKAANDNGPTTILGLDLDVCVPEWMKENFANGIYPTLEQRKVFAQDACDYVAKELEQTHQSSSSGSNVLSVVSFSFVNTDLRDIFRERFPTAEWYLIDTTPSEANRRIQLRQGHFYTHETSSDSDSSEEEEQVVIDPDNDDWNFAPVTFPHVILDGTAPIEANADKIVKVIVEKINNS